MKRILLYSTMMMFVLTLGVAYAEAGTNFGTHDAIINNNYDIGPADVPAALMESMHAGGMRETGPGLVLNNGVTDFSGKTYDTLSDIGLTAPVAAIDPAVEGSHAGGMREEKAVREISNGVTDFSGYNSN